MAHCEPPADRLRWMQQSVLAEACRAVRLVEADDLRAVWSDLQALVGKRGEKLAQCAVDPCDAKDKHPLFHVMVELLQRAIVALQLHDELGDGADGLTDDEVDALRLAARGGAWTSMAMQVPEAVAALLRALRPLIKMNRF